MMATESIFSWPVRVYYEDTDHGGVVYYANYLKFMERARSEWLRSKGIEQDRLMDEQALIFAVRSAQLDYLRPARFNQLLSVGLLIQQAGRASITFLQEVQLLESYINGGESGEVADGEVLCRGLVKVACLDANSMKPKAIPASLREEIFRDN